MHGYGFSIISATSGQSVNGAKIRWIGCCNCLDHANGNARDVNSDMGHALLGPRLVSSHGISFSSRRTSSSSLYRFSNPFVSGGMKEVVAEGSNLVGDTGAGVVADAEDEEEEEDEDVDDVGVRKRVEFEEGGIFEEGSGVC